MYNFWTRIWLFFWPTVCRSIDLLRLSHPHKKQITVLSWAIPNYHLTINHIWRYKFNLPRRKTRETQWKQTPPLIIGFEVYLNTRDSHVNGSTTDFWDLHYRENRYMIRKNLKKLLHCKSNEQKWQKFCWREINVFVIIWYSFQNHVNDRDK